MDTKTELQIRISVSPNSKCTCRVDQVVASRECVRPGCFNMATASVPGKEYCRKHTKRRMCCGGNSMGLYCCVECTNLGYTAGDGIGDGRMYIRKDGKSVGSYYPKVDVDNNRELF